ncbi:serine protease snake-like isoform X2 [Eriocheir sinensis]|uniref:serine protease snake-like isoform X2 n=1 Tax=Eriocheir sinensis TaxID=95602 RepID=UPI0021C8DC85|nr:serine protease snake-like isoform X2 [Eriocheir sinensis]
MLTVLLPVLFLLPHTAQGITKEGVGAVGEACSMGSGVRGRCQEVGACLKEGGVVVMGEQVQLCSPTPSDIIVCCRKPHLVAENLCAAWAQHWRSPAGHCIDKTNLIVGGVNADPGEYPHVALLGVRRGNLPIVWLCGGTLLTPYYVLTAAHCLKEDNVEYWVRLGEYNRNHDRSGELIPVVKGPIPSSVRYADELAADTASLSPLEQNIFVEGIINHPEYDLLLKYYDIALLKLSTKANLTERVLPACLPTDPSQDLVGHELTVIGWGYTQFGELDLHFGATEGQVERPLDSWLTIFFSFFFYVFACGAGRLDWRGLMVWPSQLWRRQVLIVAPSCIGSCCPRGAHI